MLEPMYLGLDCGTSGLKALLTDDGGAPVATAARSYSPDRPRRGWSEQDPDVWRTAMAGAIADLKSSSSRALGGLKAIGFSGQMHGAVALTEVPKKHENVANPRSEMLSLKLKACRDR